MRCFVIMPIGDAEKDEKRAAEFGQIYSEWIKPAVESIVIPKRKERIECHRADKETRPEELISHIIKNVVESDIVIADLSGNNPNVFYELGVRHAVSNNTILITQDLDAVPFDLRSQRIIEYRYEPQQLKNLEKSLHDAITKIILEPQSIDNPVRRFLYNQGENRLGIQTVTPSDMELVMLSKKDANARAKMRHIDLGFFEGIWTSASGEIFCARVVDGELYVPYCWEGRLSLTAHEFNCRLIGHTLFASFAWFYGDISGVIFHKAITEDLLDGGWWYAEHVPAKHKKDITRMSESIPGMNRIVLKRNPKRAMWPDWAEEYFRQKQHLVR